MKSTRKIKAATKTLVVEFDATGKASLKNTGDAGALVDQIIEIIKGTETAPELVSSEHAVGLEVDAYLRFDSDVIPIVKLANPLKINLLECPEDCCPEASVTGPTPFDAEAPAGSEQGPPAPQPPEGAAAENGSRRAPQLLPPPSTSRIQPPVSRKIRKVTPAQWTQTSKP